MSDNNLKEGMIIQYGYRAIVTKGTCENCCFKRELWQTLNRCFLPYNSCTVKEEGLCFKEINKDEGL